MSYEVILSNGDRAEATDPECALFAAATLCREAATGGYGERIFKREVIITRDGMYHGSLTAKARGHL